MKLILLDTNFNYIAPIDFYESCIWTDRYCKAGDFELYLSADSSVTAYMNSDYYLLNKDSEHVMIIDKTEIKTDNESGAYLTVTGKSLEIILNRRIIWTQTNISGNLQDSIERLLNENVISPADEKRRLPIIFERSDDTAITSLSIKDTQYTGDNLYDVICNLCEQYGVGFKITLNANNVFVFKLYAGINRSYSQTVNPPVLFSTKFNNLISTDYTNDKSNYKNVSLIGGEGEGSERKYTSVGDYEGMDRYELFTDARDISSEVTDENSEDDETRTLTDEEYYPLLTQRGNEDLVDYQIESNFDANIDPNDTTYICNKDYIVGDIVQLINDYNMSYAVRISEIIFSEDQNGYSVYPTLEIL